MDQPHVIANFALSGLAAVLCFFAGDRLRWVGGVLLLNFTACTIAVLAGLDGWPFKVFSSVADLTYLAMALYAMRAYPLAGGLLWSARMIMVSLACHWAAHVALLFTGNGYNFGYFVITNACMVIAALGLIWTSGLVIGARHGVANWFRNPVRSGEYWRANVGARKTWTK